MLNLYFDVVLSKSILENPDNKTQYVIFIINMFKHNVFINSKYNRIVLLQKQFALSNFK